MGTRARTTAAPEDTRGERERERTVVAAAEKHVPARKGVKEDRVSFGIQWSSGIRNLL